jgi:phosphoserine/homoserine phosphotransferase
MDLEGVLIPEIWIAFAKKTGIEELKLTTRDVSDYDELMRGRLKILRENKLKLKDIQEVIDTLDPLEGAEEYVKWVRSKAQLIILSDTFYEFAAPLMKKLGYPTLFCHSLGVDDQGYIADYFIRIPDPKRKAVISFKNLNFRVIAIGDSYNDTTMLKEAHEGILFKPPAKIQEEFPQFKAFDRYEDLKNHLNQRI